MSFFLTRMLEVFDEHASRVAFRFRGESLTYREAGKRLRELHGALDVGPSDTVAVTSGNRPDSILVQLAAQLRGARVLLIAASSAAPERKAAFEHASVTLHINRSTLDALAGAPVPITRPPSATTIFTSGGTTGIPKLIRHSGTYEGLVHVFRTDPAGPNRVLVVAPLSHLTGNTAVIGALLGGDTVVLHEGFDAPEVARSLVAERITRFSLTPPRLGALLDVPGLAAPDLRALSLGASPLPVERLRQALDVFGPIVGQGYGLTEAPMISTITAPEYDGHPERLESVGRIVPGMDARIDAGEVLVRGLSLMDGYLLAEDNDRAFTGPWLRTGDVGRFDEHGYLYLLGRANDVIVTGEHGTKVYPARIENVLTAHPRIRQAAVLGRPGPDGELVHAVVVGSLSAAEVRAHVRAELGQEHLVPATVEFAETLPLTPIGKIDKRALS